MFYIFKKIWFIKVWFSLFFLCLPFVAVAQDAPDWQKIIKTDDVDTLRILLETEEYSPETIDAKGRTLLRLSIEYKKPTMIAYLLETGLDINQSSTDGQTALHVATFSRDNTTIKALLARNANPNQQNKAGETPLYMAAFYGYDEIVLMMLKKGGRLNIRNNVGDLPLTHAPIAVQNTVATFQGKAPQASGLVQQPQDEVSEEISLLENQKIQARKRAQAIIQYEIERQSYQAAQLKTHQQWIKKLSDGRNRYRKQFYNLLEKQFDEFGGGGLISKADESYAFGVVIGHEKLGKPTPLVGFIPVLQTVPETADIMKLVSENAKNAMAYFNNLYDWLLIDDLVISEKDKDELIALIPEITTLKANKVSKLRAARQENSPSYQGIFFYDALVRLLQKFDLKHIDYNEETQHLMIDLSFYHGLITQSFMIENVTTEIAEQLLANQDNIGWNMRFTITPQTIELDEIMFFTANVTLNATAIQPEN